MVGDICAWCGIAPADFCSVICDICAKKIDAILKRELDDMRPLYESMGDVGVNVRRLKTKIGMDGKIYATDEYAEYLKSDAWKKKREQVIDERGEVCEICSKDVGVFHIHHKSYRHFKQERMYELAVLCSGCHASVHGIDWETVNAVS